MARKGFKKESDGRKVWEESYSSSEKREFDRTTLSGMEVPPLCDPSDMGDFDFASHLGYPGDYPFTRGIYDTMYAGRLWTMRQFAGFGSPLDTNKRFKFLLENGQTGLSVAFDMPTLMGYDCDHHRAMGEVGKEGVSVCSLADVEALFDGIRLDRVSTSMTINCTATIIFAMYLVVAEKQGIAWDKLSGTLQNDMLKEFIAQREWISPPRPSVKLVVDIVEFCTRKVPRWHPVSISGYHIREAGSTAVQELAFTLADGLCYVDECIERGLKVDEFAPRLSFFFNSHIDFFEEVAKLRAARRLWARLMKEKYGAQDPRSQMLRTHSQTSGVSLTAQQPLNNIVRVTLQALASVLGGTQSLHTNSMDETLALPSEQAVTVALRTQQVLAEESGVANTIDPLGGSYFVEHLTNRMENDAVQYIDKIDEMGGMIKAIDYGFPQTEIANAAYEYQKLLDERRKVIVGVNKYATEDEEVPIPTLKIGEEVEREQRRRVAAVKKKRSGGAVDRDLKAIADAAQEGKNLMPFIIDAVRDYATLGEISDVFRKVYGEFRDPGYF